MTRQTQADMGAFLAEHLERIAPDLERMAAPYEALAEYRRRVEISARYVADMDCRCGVRLGGHTFEGECDKHYLERVLDGDE